MLDTTVREQLQTYVDMLEGDVIFTVSVNNDESSQKLKDFIEEVTTLSDKLSLRYETLTRTPSFRLDRKEAATGITFAGIPLGHELTSFVLALLQVSGRKPKIDNALIQRIQAIQKPLNFETYVSLTCHICPDVVQALNIMSVLNPQISHTMIEGSIYQEEIKEHTIMAVPTVFLNQEPFNSGRMTLEEILDQAVGQEALQLDTSTLYDVFVIGGGPAGVSAAVYATRKGLKVALVSDRLGGQVLETATIENIIGTLQTEGPRFARNLEEHIRTYEIDIINTRLVTHIEKTVVVEIAIDEQIFKSKTAIIATGAHWRQVNVPGEEEFKNKGVAYCPHCDGPLFVDKEVAVIGGGNSGIEAAIDLAQVTKHVTVLEFLPELKADDILQKRLHELRNVTIITNAQTTEIHGNETVTGLSYQNREDNSSHQLELDGVFVQIGLIPNTEWLGSQFAMTPTKEIIVDAHGMTSIPGIFAAGDCTSSPYKQIIISMGSGATAALSAFDYLIRET